MSILAGMIACEAAAFAQLVPWNIDPNGLIRLDPNQPAVDWPDRSAEEVYRRDGAQIVPWTHETALPNSDNAALLYYQALLLRPQPDDATSVRINAVLRGDLPDSSVRSYLGACRKMIYTAEVASRTPQCTWGIGHFDTARFGEIDLIGQIRLLPPVLALDARTLGVDGRYDAAFARCLTMRRIARHVGDDTMFIYLVSRSIEELATHTMQYLLALAPADVDFLQQVRGQLAAVPGASRSFGEIVQSNFEQSVEQIRQNPVILEAIRLQIADGENSQKKVLSTDLTDDEIATQARETCLPALNGILQAIDSDAPYERKYTEIDRRTQDFAQQFGNDPMASWLWSFATGSLVERYSLSVRNTTAANALKTAVEIYLSKAQTGQWPEALPAYTPKDLYSGQDFEYETTPTGFVLRCQAEDLYYNRVYQYEFTVRE